MKAKEKLIEKIFKWVSKGAEIVPEKERLLRMMIEATLDYLILHDMLEDRPNGKEDEKSN